ncbi:nicastrin isoform X4 [Fagus crenata]
MGDDHPLGLSQTPFHIPNPIEKSSSSKYAMATKFLYLLLLLFNFHFRLSFSRQSNFMESVPDLQKSLYKVIDGYPCVRLLNLSGPIGCSSKILNLSKLRFVL